jgi:hypothetical protein
MQWLIRSAMRDMMPATAALPGIAGTGLDAFLAKVHRESPFLVWIGLVLGALVYVLSPVLTVYLPLPSMWLPAAIRERHAQRITTTSHYFLRQSIFLLKMYACMCWGQDAAVRRQLNIAPYPIDPGSFRTT